MSSILEALGAEGRDVGMVAGVAAGMVTNNQDPEGLGRIKIKFPWLSDDNETDWVRMATMMTGGERGSFFLPEVGDEVLVGFEHGDINFPYVLGALWNGQAQPPGKNADGKNNIRKITSRSGHEIIFDDNQEQGKEKLEIHTKGGHRVVLDDATGKEKVEVVTKAGHKLVMDDSPGKEKVELVDQTGRNKFSIDSVKNAINIESALSIKLKANMVEIEGTGSLTLKSSALLTVKGMPVKIN